MKYIVIVLLFISCAFVPPENTELKKPFVITWKFTKSAQCNDGDCRYEYRDANNIKVLFCESPLKSSIGDTIR